MPLLSEVADIRHGEQPIVAATLGDAFQWGHFPLTIDDFNGQRKLVQNNTSSFPIIDPGPFDGSPALQRTATTSHIVTASDVALRPYDGPGRRVLSCRVMLQTTTSGAANLAGLALWDGTAGNGGFQFLLDSRRASSGGSAAMQVRTNAGTTPPIAGGLEAPHPAVGTAYRIEAEWNARPSGDPEIRFRAFTDSGQLLRELVGSTALYKSVPLYAGVYGYNLAAYDDVVLTYTT